MKTKYTCERNIQILISLLKEYNIKDIIISPGTTNISFVASVQMDDFFNIYSCVDERSAAYIACGMASKLDKPVVITCTGATASRNYLSGLTEAFYSKIPIIAVTATQHLGRIGQNIPQVIDRTVQINDTVKKSVQLTPVYSQEDEWSCNLKLNEAFHELFNNGGGPIHINMVTNYSNEFVYNELPKEKVIRKFNYYDVFPKIEEKNVAIFIGRHKKIDKLMEKEIDLFCEKYNGVVLCDYSSNYYGKYRIYCNILSTQNVYQSLNNIDLLIDFGHISATYTFLAPKKVWRISEDGVIRDSFKKIDCVFNVKEIDFFKKYNNLNNNTSTLEYYNLWKEKCDKLYNILNNIDIPFSNIWISNQIINKINDNSIVHLGILNTIRSWNFFNTNKNLEVYCNTGGFGIDGVLSSAVGSSMVSNKNVYCFIGDLSFFYDMNSIGNRDIKNNLRILLINNGCGTEFHNYSHRAEIVSSSNEIDSSYFAADGHFGNKSKDLVKHYSVDLGFEYICASNKTEFEKNITKFLSDENNKPILFEVFTDSKLESEALKIINNLIVPEDNIKNKIKRVIGEKNIKKIKRIIGK